MWVLRGREERVSFLGRVILSERRTRFYSIGYKAVVADL